MIKKIKNLADLPVIVSDLYKPHNNAEGNVFHNQFKT